MADSASFRVDGARQLRSSMRKAGADMSQMRAIHLRIGGVIVPVAKRLAPVGPDVGGHIGGTIRAGASQAATTIRAGGKSRPYGARLHWGWFRRGQTPQPWISQAARSTEPRWTAVYFDGIETILDTIKGV